MRQLNLSDALNLYDLIGQFIPDGNPEDYTITEFIGTIIDNIIKHSSQRNYVKALMLILDKNQEDILSMSPKDAVSLFIDGLIENDIITLKRFCEEINYGRWQF